MVVVVIVAVVVVVVIGRLNMVAISVLGKTTHSITIGDDDAAAAIITTR